MKKRCSNLVSFLLFVSLLFSISFPSRAFASSYASHIRLTPELAETTAENFALNLGKKVHAISTQKFYNSNDCAIGYIVYVQDDFGKKGYVVLDNSQSDFISEFSFSEGNNASSPHIESEIPTNTNALRSYQPSSSKLYKTSPFSYCSKTAPTSWQLFSSGKHNSKWEDIFVLPSTIYENYNLEHTNHLAEFYTLSESEVEQITKHYACSVSAAYICAYYYGANIGVIDPNLEKDYMDIWQKTKTSVYRISGGITEGSTYDTDVAPGINAHLNSKHISARAKHSANIRYTDFTRSIDSKNIAILHCGINQHDGRHGHSMAVEGYCTIQKKNDQSRLHTLMVCDGWDTGNVRYVNLDYAYFTDYTGTLFHE